MPPVDVTNQQWIQVIIQGGALGVLVLGIVLLYYIARALFSTIPIFVKDTLKEINDNNRSSQALQHENGKLEREGFATRTKMLVDELSSIRKEFPILGIRIDKMIDEIRQQTKILKEWPSDPKKMCMVQQAVERIEHLISGMEEFKAKHGKQQ